MGGRGEAPLEGEQLAYAQSQEQRLANFIAGSDVLIIDCQYSTSDYERHVGWGHSSIEDSVALGVKAGVRRCFPFHYEPTYEDRELDSLIDSARQQVALLGSDMIVEGAREGVEVVLEPAKAGQAQT
jgi:ribonuclease BN (tRNA processing enzyme)